MANDPTEFTAEVEQLIAVGDFELALDRVKAVAHGASRPLYDEVVLLQARATRLRSDGRKGIIGRDDAETQRNRLTLALLDVAKEITRSISHLRQPSKPPAMSARVESVPQVALQQIIGINNLKQISWIEVGLKASRSVCRILTPTGYGTGFLVGGDVLLTNNHVIPSTEIAAGSQAEFDYQQDQSGGFLPAVRYQLDSAGFHTSVALDYSVVRVQASAEKPPLAKWGVLKLNANADPNPSEHVIVVQHPNGGYKQIVLTANWVVAASSPWLHYTTDTMPGSSGSPVFNDSWHVIAIHHAGGHLVPDKQGSVRYVNEGVLMSAIRADAGAHWPQ